MGIRLNGLDIGQEWDGHQSRVGNVGGIGTKWAMTGEGMGISPGGAGEGRNCDEGWVWVWVWVWDWDWDVMSFGR